MSRTYLGSTLIERSYFGADFVSDIQILGPLNVEYIIVAGGGGGGLGGGGGSPTFNTLGGGGGAGGVITGSAYLLSNSYSVVVGNAGTGGVFASATKPTNGVSSSFLSLNAIGGGAAGNGAIDCSFSSGSIGGSGGGGGSRSGILGCTTAAGTVNQGNSGSQAGGGGGATSTAAGNVGGNGLTWLNGETYAQGGSTVSNADRTTRGSGGRGGNFFPNTPRDGQNGVNGVVEIRYLGTPQATGGTITQSDGYTYHEFTSSGTFTY
jgi:hypothetical protein